MSDKVLSPVWQALNDLHRDVQRNLHTVATALQDADRRMAGGKGDVWVGPAAVRWGGDLSGAAQDVSRKAHAFAEYVERELSRRPREVTRAEADTERRMLAGRGAAF